MASKRGLDGEHLLTDESNGKRSKADLNGDSSHLEAHSAKVDDLDEGEEEEGDFNDEEEEVDVIEEGEDGTLISCLHSCNVDNSNRFPCLESL